MCMLLGRFLALKSWLYLRPFVHEQNVPGTEKCSPEPFTVLADRSKYVDQQTLKLQVRAGTDHWQKYGHKEP